MKPLACAVVGAVALAAATVPAAAQTVYEPAGPYYFQCQGSQPAMKVQNNIRTHSWSPTAPSASYTTGAGCGYLDPGPIIGTRSDTAYDMSVGGTFAGAVDTINVELHNLLVGQARLSQGTPLKLRMLIDGEERIDPAAPIEFEGTTELSESGLSEKVTFSITNLKLPAVAEGDERQFVLDIGSPYLDSSNAFVWGATEIPAHVTFNPVKLASPKVRVP